MKTKLLLLFAFFAVTIKAQTVSIPDSQLKFLLTNTNCADFNDDGIYDGDVDTNNDGEIQLSEAINVTGLNLVNELFDEGNEIIVSNLMGLEAFSNLKELSISKINLNVGELNFTNFTFLESLTIENTDSDSLTNIVASNLLNLITLNLNVIRPADFDLPNDKIQVNLTGCINLETLNYYNSFLSFNFCEIPQLKNLDCSYLEGGEPDDGIFDFSCLTALENLNIDENFIEALIIKNGSMLNEITMNYWDYLGYPQFVCIDDNQAELNQIMSLEGIGPETVINEYCNFELGGAIHNLSGSILYDFNDNGCDINDIPASNTTFYIEDNVYNRYLSSNELGSYSTFLYSASTTITPILENSSSFTISPTELAINESEFEVTMNQDFCITTSTESEVLNVYIIPIDDARPGLNSRYKIIYKNIGTSVLSGELVLNYMNDLMTLVISNPTYNESSAGSLKYLFSNLLPFQTREIEIILNLNSSTNPIPVVAGDILSFSLIGRYGPNQSLENEFEMIQTVIQAPIPCGILGVNGPTIPNESSEDFVHFVLNFENTENATVQNLAVKINLDPTKFELSSLKPIYANHSFSSRISPNGKVEFYFKDINLTTDSSTNNAHILYKVKPKNTVVAGDILLTSANVYLDNNNPIASNVFSSEIQNTLGLIPSNQQKIRFYPNPVVDVLNFETNETIINFDVFDMTGKLLLSHSATENNINLNELNKGLYIVKVNTAQNVFVIKIIKN